MVRTKASFRLIEYTSRLRIHERIYYTVDTVPVQVFHVSEIDSLLTYQVLDLLLVGIKLLALLCNPVGLHGKPSCLTFAHARGGRA